MCVCVFYNLNEIYITKIDLFLKKYSEYSLNELIFWNEKKIYIYNEYILSK